MTARDRIRRSVTVCALAAAGGALSGCDELSVIAILQNSGPAPAPVVTAPIETPPAGAGEAKLELH